jgi:NAD(P)H-flavin reductase
VLCPFAVVNEDCGFKPNYPILIDLRGEQMVNLVFGLRRKCALGL